MAGLLVPGEASQVTALVVPPPKHTPPNLRPIVYPRNRVGLAHLDGGKQAERPAEALINGRSPPLVLRPLLGVVLVATGVLVTASGTGLVAVVAVVAVVTASWRLDRHSGGRGLCRVGSALVLPFTGLLHLGRGVVRRWCRPPVTARRRSRCRCLIACRENDAKADYMLETRNLASQTKVSIWKKKKKTRPSRHLHFRVGPCPCRAR